MNDAFVVGVGKYVYILFDYSTALYKAIYSSENGKRGSGSEESDCRMNLHLMR